MAGLGDRSTSAKQQRMIDNIKNKIGDKLGGFSDT